jgi:hypothetical protein
MELRLSPRMITDLPGRRGLRCSCGARPDLVQPDPLASTTLIGVCGCTLWTIYVMTGQSWRSAMAFELGFSPRDHAAMCDAGAGAARQAS